MYLFSFLPMCVSAGIHPLIRCWYFDFLCLSVRGKVFALTEHILKLPSSQHFISFMSGYHDFLLSVVVPRFLGYPIIIVNIINVNCMKY